MMSTWLLSACISGVITLHGLMPAVLQTFPDRHCIDCDGYIALVDCASIGKSYRLFVNGKTFRVKTADCVTHTPPSLSTWPRKGGKLWLGDLDAILWATANLPLAPSSAMLCPDDVSPSRHFDWRLDQ